MALQQVTDADYQAEVLEGGAVVVDFWGPSWPACDALAPVVEEVAGEVGDVKFVKANLQETFDNASELGVMAIPTLVFYKDGQEVTRLVGAVPKAKILGAVEKLK